MHVKSFICCLRLYLTYHNTFYQYKLLHTKFDIPLMLAINDCYTTEAEKRHISWKGSQQNLLRWSNDIICIAYYPYLGS